MRRVALTGLLAMALVACGGAPVDSGGASGFEGTWVETEFTGQFPDGVLIEPEGDHLVWTDDDGSFIARIDENGALIIDLGIGEATAVLVDPGEMVARFMGSEARFRRQTSEDLERAAADETPEPCDVVSTSAIADAFGDESYLNPRTNFSACVFRGGLANVFTVEVIATSLAEWQAEWANRCEVHETPKFEHGVICVEPTVTGAPNWTGSYWAEGLSIVINTRWPAGLSLGGLEAIVQAIEVGNNTTSQNEPDAIAQGAATTVAPTSTVTTPPPSSTTTTDSSTTSESLESELARDIDAIMALWDGYTDAWKQGVEAGWQYLAENDSYGCSPGDYQWSVSDQFQDEIVVEPGSIQRDDAWYTEPDRVYVMTISRTFSGESSDFVGQEGEGQAHVAFWNDGSVSFFFGC